MILKGVEEEKIMSCFTNIVRIEGIGTPFSVAFVSFYG